MSYIVTVRFTNTSHTAIFHSISAIPSWYVLCILGLSDTTALAIYRDILKVLISRYFVINYRDTMPVHFRH